MYDVDVRHLLIIAFVCSCGRTQWAGSDRPAPQPPDQQTIVAATDGGWATDSRLVLWLKSDEGFAPDHWVDQSQAHNDAYQTMTLRQPHAANGLVMFDGNQFMRIEDATSLQWSSGGWSLFAVMEQALPMYGWAIVYAKWTDASPLVTGAFLWASYPYTPWDGPAFNGYVGRIDINREVISRGPYNDGPVRLVAIVRDGDSFAMRINGNVVDTNTGIGGFDAAAFDAAGLPAYIGGREDMSFQALQGGIAELMAFKGSLSAADLSSVEHYLMTRHSL